MPRPLAMARPIPLLAPVTSATLCSVTCPASPESTRPGNGRVRGSESDRMGFWSDVGNAVSSTVSTVGDVVEDVVDGVTDTVQDAVDGGIDGLQGAIGLGQGWLCRHAGSVGCGVGNVLGGLVDGGLTWAQDVVDIGANIARDSVGIAGSVLRLDLPGVIDEAGDLVLDVLNGGVTGVRFGFGGYFVGGIVDAFEREELRRFVSALLDERFAGEPDRLATARDRIGLDNGRVQLPLTGRSMVFCLDSAIVPLADWHERGLIDLYAMAGLLSFDSFSVVRAQTAVTLVGPDGTDTAFPVGRLQISRFLESGGQGWRLRVYALSRPALARHLATATRTCRELGVRIEWTDDPSFAWFREFARYDVQDEEEFRMSFGGARGLATWTVRRELRTGDPAEDCTVLALATFAVPVADLGLTFGRVIDEGPDAAGCATPGRTDSCCITVDRAAGSGLVYQEKWPQTILGYVLPHEIGHYLGLCHFGHDGVQNVMYTRAAEAGLDTVGWSTLWGYYRSREPRFTLVDAKNSWRFLADQMPHCLAPAGPVPVVE